MDGAWLAKEEDYNPDNVGSPPIANGEEVNYFKF
jgi:hypothetical protein